MLFTTYKILPSLSWTTFLLEPQGEIQEAEPGVEDDPSSQSRRASSQFLHISTELQIVNFHSSDNFRSRWHLVLARPRSQRPPGVSEVSELQPPSPALDLEVLELQQPHNRPRLLEVLELQQPLLQRLQDLEDLGARQHSLLLLLEDLGAVLPPASLLQLLEDLELQQPAQPVVGLGALELLLALLVLDLEDLELLLQLQIQDLEDLVQQLGLNLQLLDLLLEQPALGSELQVQDLEQATLDLEQQIQDLELQTREGFGATNPGGFGATNTGFGAANTGGFGATNTGFGAPNTGGFGATGFGAANTGFGAANPGFGANQAGAQVPANPVLRMPRS